MNPKLQFTSALLTAALLYAGRSAHAYIDLAPSFSNVVGSAPTIAVVEVSAFDRAAQTVTFKPVETLKGTLEPGPIVHPVAPKGGMAPRAIVQWAIPGSRAVIFIQRGTARNITLLCYGTGWYEVTSVGTGAWKVGAERPDLPLAYYGSVSRLIDAVKALQNNQGAVITVVAFGADSEGASFDLALNRQSLPGVVRLQRIRATANMPGSIASASSNPSYFIGPGVVDDKDLPALLEKLKSPDAVTRAEAIEDLRTLGRKARSALPALAALMADASPRVRFDAASAVLQITPRNPQGIPILQAGLSDKDPVVRLYAAAAAGYAGAAGEPLADKLAALLKDSDESVRLTALESISMLGPAAAKAVPALLPLLDDKATAIDAADALGRIGIAARPAMKKLAELLASDQPAVRWAAVRGMAQIGGPDAKPAVDFMIKAMASATEVEGYNMMVYFIMLGPDGRDAAPALQNFRIKNPTLPGVAYWAQNPTSFPWQAGGGFGGFGGRGGGGGRGGPGGPGGPGGGGPGDLNTLAYSSAVRELGPRLAGLAPQFATAIMSNTAGDVPVWGYDLLNAAPERSLAIFLPNLQDADLALRERAAVGLGYMGDTATSAKLAVEAALAKAATEREKKLLEWTLRQIDTD